MGFVLIPAIISVLIGICVAQLDLYSSAYDQSGYAHKIELDQDACINSQDQYAIYFWHRFSFTTPKYQGNIKPMALARLTLSSSFQDHSSYSDHVESNGIAFTVCSHDITSNNINYKREGTVSIYINFVSQSIQISASLTSVLNTKIGNYLGLFLGGSTYLPTALNGWFFNPQILLGQDSQISSLSGLTKIMNESPPYDYIRDQHIQIQEGTSITANGIYTRLGFYGSFILNSSVGSSVETVLSVNGVNGATGILGSKIIEILIINDKLRFSSDNYVSMTSTSDDVLNSLIADYPITFNQIFTFYVDVNMEDSNVLINCNQKSSPDTFLNRKNFIPSKIIMSQNTFANGDYLETNFIGANFNSNATEYAIMLTQSISIPRQIKSGLTGISQFSLCYWWRLNSVFPIFTTQAQNSLNLQNISLISLNTVSTGISDCSSITNMLVCGSLLNYKVSFNTKSNSSPISSSDFDDASVEWQWNSSCVTYKDATSSNPSISKVYQYIGYSYKETSLLNQNLVLSSVSDLYLQLYFTNDVINKQFYNIRIAINNEDFSYLSELYIFAKYTANVPPVRGDTSMYQANIFPNSENLSSTITYSMNGLQFTKEQSVTLWCKMSNPAVDATIVKVFMDSSYSYVGKMFEVKYWQSSQIIQLLTYSKLNFYANDDANIQVSIQVSVSTCDMSQFFFIYLGYTKFLNEVKLGILCNQAGVIQRLYGTSTIYQLPMHSFNLIIDPALFSGTIAQVKGYFGQNGYESKLFTEANLAGKWECAYKTFSCTSPQISNTDGSTQCKDTYAYDSVNNRCLSQCPCGYYANPNSAIPYTCTLCNLASLNCLQCIDNSDTSQCTFCEQGLTVVPPSGSFLPDVNKGQCQCRQQGYIYGIQGSCIICNAPCVECTGTSLTCTKCSSLAYLQGTQCYCIDGYYMDTNGICLPCGIYCLKCVDNANKCTACYDSQFRVINSSKNTCDCTSNYAESINAVTSNLQCVYCDPDSGYIRLSPTSCQLCNGNCLTCETTTVYCKSCEISLYRELNASTNTCDCLQGYFSPSSTSACLKCPDICKECTSSTFCTACSSDKVLQLTGSNQTCICDANQFYYEESVGSCGLVTLSASLSDYYSTTNTYTIYFRIIFTNNIDQSGQRPSTLIDSITMEGLPNSINPINTVSSNENHHQTSMYKRLLTNGSELSFQVSLSWESDSIIFVKVEFFKSFMQKQLLIKFKGNQFITSNSADGNFLLTQSLTLPINLIIYLPKEQLFSSVLENIIDGAIQLSNPSNIFTEFLIYLARDCYLILIAFPFFSIIIVFLSFSTILPANFFHLLRMFSHLILLQNTAMQEENNQTSSVDFLFKSQSKSPSMFRDNMEDNFKRLNFTNSYILMVISPTILIVFFHLIYLILNKYYDHSMESIIKESDESNYDNLKIKISLLPSFKRIRSIFIFFNMISSVMIKNLLIILTFAAIINLKSQYLLEAEQVFGYILSMLMLWGLITYLLNIFSIITNRLHYQANEQYKTYYNFILIRDKTDNIEWEDLLMTIDNGQEQSHRDIPFDSGQKQNKILFKCSNDEKNPIEQGDEFIHSKEADTKSKLQKILGYKRFYHLINVARKIIIVAFIVAFQGQFFGQIIPFLMLQVIFIAIVLLMRPKANLILNILKIVAEISILVIIVMVFITHKMQSNLLDDYPNSSIPDDKIASFLSIGTAMMAFLSLYLFLLFITNCIEIVSSAQQRISQNHSPCPETLSDSRQLLQLNQEFRQIPEFEIQYESVKVQKVPVVQMELAPIERSQQSLEYTKYNLSDNKMKFQFEYDNPIRFKKTKKNMLKKQE